MRYRFTIGGLLGDRLTRSLGGRDLEHLDHETRLTFELRDQAELLGLIDRLGNLGLDLVAIESLDVTTVAAPAGVAEVTGSGSGETGGDSQSQKGITPG